MDGLERLSGKGISYGAARSEASNTHGIDIHIIGAGNSAGQAALFFSTHARSVTLVCRGDRLEKSMSRYLVDQLATRSNIVTLLGAKVTAVHGERSLEAVDIHEADTGETTRHESGGLFVFIGADAQTGWLPPEIALDERGFVLTGTDMHDPRRLGAPARPLSAGDERAGHLRLRRRPVRPGQARRRRRRGGEHGDRVRAPVPQGGRCGRGRGRPHAARVGVPVVAAVVAAATILAGHSVHGTPIQAVRTGASDAPRTVLVVGDVHGNERAGRAVIRLLRRTAPPAGVQVWTVATANPDGERAGTRHNAHGVDLNRNFPDRWRPGARGDVFYPGPSVASEPETKAVQRLVRRLRPDVTVYYHQAPGPREPAAAQRRSRGRPRLRAEGADAGRVPARPPRHGDRLAERHTSRGRQPSWSSCPRAPSRPRRRGAMRGRCSWPAAARRRRRPCARG